LLAAKYRVADLKVACEAEIAKRLTEANVFDVLKAADEANADRLKASAIDFIVSHLVSSFYQSLFLSQSINKKILKNILAYYNGAVIVVNTEIVGSAKDNRYRQVINLEVEFLNLKTFPLYVPVQKFED
jgi:hypothetical protein